MQKGVQVANLRKLFVNLAWRLTVGIAGGGVRPQDYFSFSSFRAERWHLCVRRHAGYQGCEGSKLSAERLCLMQSAARRIPGVGKLSTMPKTLS